MKNENMTNKKILNCLFEQNNEKTCRDKQMTNQTFIAYTKNLCMRFITHCKKLLLYSFDDM